MPTDTSKLNIVLIEPEIPQNTGNIARTCACIGARLHLIEPMGFRLSDKNLSRSGCDYWDKVEIVRWSCVGEFFGKHGEDELHLFTGKSKKAYTDVSYSPNCYLVFGKESAGIDEEILQKYASCCVRIPMLGNLRSLNLSNAVAVGAYEALRQNSFGELV
ncbi:MAG: tRNA (cytidine(34)-2'-O)-methyltransferase [Eggerthellaceae bacterium]|nr:tRNA (cytidine(34)-2'-O)-methyltransferase [Eggerthellaceae bacterium]